MRLSRRRAVSVISGAVPLFALGGPAVAASVVKVALWDKGPTSMDGMEGMLPMGMAMAGAGTDMVTMGITADPAQVPAGQVTFRIINESGEFYHGLTISPVGDPTRELPYLIDKAIVDEDAAGLTARTKELKPHASGSVTVDLQPGSYILYCNIPGHYVMGMWTLVTVTG